MQNAYVHVLGAEDNEFGNFRQLINTRYDQSYDQQNIDLLLDISEEDPSRKELWTTEQNLKDRDDEYDATSIQQKILTSFGNTFAHGLITQEWYMKDLKKNFDPDFRQGFHTYSIFHAYGGGGHLAMLMIADTADRLNHRDETDPMEPIVEIPFPGIDTNIWLKRTVYQTYLLLSEIAKNDLKYLRADYTKYTHNHNIQPTLFLDATPGANALKGYYSNMKGETQTYILKLGHLPDLYPGAVAIGYGTVQIFSIDALKPYSNSGNNKTYVINSCYNDDDHLHPFEIQDTTGPSASYVPECSGLPGGAICITVPAYSCGYFVAPIYTAPRQGGIDETYRFDVNPNPSTGMISIKPNYLVANLQECLVTVFNQNGELLLANNMNEQGIIDLSYLPNGLYYVKIMDPIVGVVNTERLIIIK